jgi:hypothetical protein
MKKISFIMVCFLSLLILVSCVSKSDLGTTSTQEGFLKRDETTTQPIESTTENTVILHPEIEKVIVEYADNTEEYTESQIMFDFIDKIENCDTIPNVQLKNKIGQMKIQYKDSADLVLFADLYLGADGAIYAKYIKSTNTEFAYKISN